MTTSSYALRDSTTQQANTITPSSPPPFASSSFYSSAEYYTDKDPQYHKNQHTLTSKKSNKSRNKKMSSASKRSTLKSNKKRTKNASKTLAPRLLSSKLSSSSTSSPHQQQQTNVGFQHPNPNDVLCGRGGNINNHPGNIRYRAYVAKHKNEYNLTTNKITKAHISQSVIHMIHEMGGRFLTKDSTGGSGKGRKKGAVRGGWVEVDNSKAMSKTSQALREGAPSIRAMATKDDSQQQHDYDDDYKPTTGKRKRGGKTSSSSSSRKCKSIYSSTNDENYDQDHQDESISHPLIVPMPHGHRGKQLIPRSDHMDHTMNNATEQQQQYKQTPSKTEEEVVEKVDEQDTNVNKNQIQNHTQEIENQNLNNCISFDEGNNDSGGEVNGELFQSSHYQLSGELERHNSHNKRLKYMSTYTTKNTILDANAPTPPPSPTMLQQTYPNHETPMLLSSSSHVNGHVPPVDVFELQPNSDADTIHFDDMHVQPPITPLMLTPTPAPVSSTDIVRSHSLASSEINGSEYFHGDEKFINPFLYDSNGSNESNNWYIGDNGKTKVIPPVVASTTAPATWNGSTVTPTIAVHVQPLAAASTTIETPRFDENLPMIHSFDHQESESSNSFQRAQNTVSKWNELIQLDDSNSNSNSNSYHVSKSESDTKKSHDSFRNNSRST